MLNYVLIGLRKATAHVEMEKSDMLGEVPVRRVEALKSIGLEA